MLLINKYGRVVDVSEELAQELLANPKDFEIYQNQETNRWGAKVYGFANIGGATSSIVEKNKKENDEFNPSTIKHIDPKKGGYPVEGAYSKTLEDENVRKDTEIDELKRLLKKTIEEKEKKKAICEKCGKEFEPPDNRYKLCKNCRK